MAVTVQDPNNPKFGACPWGGEFQLRWIRAGVMPGAIPEGFCPNCGSRVYPPATLHRLEAASKLPISQMAKEDKHV